MARSARAHEPTTPACAMRSHGDTDIFKTIYPRRSSLTLQQPACFLLFGVVSLVWQAVPRCCPAPNLGRTVRCSSRNTFKLSQGIHAQPSQPRGLHPCDGRLRDSPVAATPSTTEPMEPPDWHQDPPKNGPMLNVLHRSPCDHRSRLVCTAKNGWPAPVTSTWYWQHPIFRTGRCATIHSPKHLPLWIAP
jgi:hypothetical protein